MKNKSQRLNFNKNKTGYLLLGSIGPLIVPERADLRTEHFRLLKIFNSSI